MKNYLSRRTATVLLSAASAFLITACGGGGGSSTPAPDVPPPAWGSAGLLIPAGQQSKTIELGNCRRTWGYDYNANEGDGAFLPNITIYSAKMVVKADGSMTFRGSMTEGGTLTDIASVPAVSVTYRDLGIDAEDGKISSIDYYMQMRTESSEDMEDAPYSSVSLNLGASTSSESEGNDSYVYRTVRSETENISEDFGECDGAISLEALMPVYLIDEARVANLFLKPITQIDPDFFDDDDARIISRNLVWENRSQICTPEEEGCNTLYGTSLNLDTAELKFGGDHSNTTGLPASPTPIKVTLAKLLSLTSGYGYYYEGYSAATPNQQESYDLELEIEDSLDPNVPNFEIELYRVGSTVYNDNNK